MQKKSYICTVVKFCGRHIEEIFGVVPPIDEDANINVLAKFTGYINRFWCSHEIEIYNPVFIPIYIVDSKLERALNENLKKKQRLRLSHL